MPLGYLLYGEILRSKRVPEMLLDPVIGSSYSRYRQSILFFRAVLLHYAAKFVTF